MTTKHKIRISFDQCVLWRIPLILWLRRCISVALWEEGVSFPCEVNVLVTDDAGIRVVNRESRKCDLATDVLSFPMFELTAGTIPANFSACADPETGLIPIGDMVISMERAQAQAKEYGHSVQREVSYLAVHSVLHLLGYDHMDEGAMKKQMRRREETILAELVLPRKE